MSTSAEARPASIARLPLPLWAWLAAGVVLTLVVGRKGLVLITHTWDQPEYSHGVLIPPIVGYLIRQRRAELASLGLEGSWLGFGVVVGGLAIWLAGDLSTIYTVSQYALLVMLYGVILSSVGPRVFARLLVPLLMLSFTIPLPAFLYNNLSTELQLVSSSIGAELMRSLGISVFVNGNVIDLGNFQMQVAEACSGLRYLFPLMTLGFIVAYFFRAPLWQRALVFLSSIPLTVLMNSLRIAMIGVFADFGNTSLAEGLLHELQGWVIFMASGALLLLETWVLARVFFRDRAWREVLAFDAGSGAPLARGPKPERRSPPASLAAATLVLAAAVLLSYWLPARADVHPQRGWFVDFPMRLGAWEGRQGRIDDVYLNALHVDDYLMADYTDGDAAVNLYAAYYGSQRQGASIHSPRSCIPGGGWRIAEFGQIALPGPAEGDARFETNRALIELGNERELVYYWFKQRQRHLTNEYAVKWYIFVDALFRHRTDGALIRLVTPIRKGEPVADADRRLASFARLVRSEMSPYVPD